MAEKPALLPAYLIVGPDELKRKQAVARLRARVEGPFSAFNLEELVAGGDLEPVAVLASLNTLPMGGDRRVVVVESAEKLPKAVSEAIVDYLKDPNQSCTLALVAATLAKSTRLYKAVAKVGPRSVIECAAKKGRDLPPYVQKLASAHGVAMAPDAARELVARVGESTTMLDTQVATLAALLGGAGTITLPFVEKNVARVAEVKPWEFLDRLSERDAHRALALYRLLDGSAPRAPLARRGPPARAPVCAVARRARSGAGPRSRAEEAGLAGEKPRPLGAGLFRGRARAAPGGVRPRGARAQERRGRRCRHAAARRPHLRRRVRGPQAPGHPSRSAKLAKKRTRAAPRVRSHVRWKRRSYLMVFTSFWTPLLRWAAWFLWMMPLEAALSSRRLALLAASWAASASLASTAARTFLTAVLSSERDRAVALTRLLSGDDALLLRLDVSHVQFLSVPNLCEASVLRHGEVNPTNIAYRPRVRYHFPHGYQRYLTYPQLLDRCAHRPRQVDHLGPHPRAHPHRGGARHGGPAARHDGHRAGARHHHQVQRRPRHVRRRRRGRPTSSTSSTRRATSTSPTRSPAVSLRARGRCWWWTPRRVWRPRRSPTPTWP